MFAPWLANAGYRLVRGGEVNAKHQQSRIAPLQKIENSGNVGKLAHKEANREKSAEFGRREES